MSGRPQIAHVPTVGSGSIPVNASALSKSEPRIRSMPFLITPVPFEWFPKGACTRPLLLRAGGIAAVLLLDFKLLRKSGAALPRSRESLDPHMTADLRSRIQVRRLCCQNLMEIMKLLIDFGRIGNRARHFRSQRFAIALTQTRKPGAQRRDGNSKFCGRFFLT